MAGSSATTGAAKDRPTLLMVGRGEPMDAALRQALDRHGLFVEEAEGDDLRSSVMMTAPDLVLLVGDAAAEGGRAVLDQLAANPATAVTPVAVLGGEGHLDHRLAAFRHGAVAVVPRSASADAVARRVAQIARELGDRADGGASELGEATFEELVQLVSRELRSGILSVERQTRDGEPMRVVLGAGRPVAEAVEEFVRRLRPLVSRAEPLRYEFQQASGGRVGLLDGDPSGEGDVSVFEGLRVLLIDHDPARADALAQELRGRRATVAVADTSGRGLDRVRGLDPEVVILDATGIEGPGFEVVRAIRKDVRLRWAAMLVAPWDEIWPDTAAAPDVRQLAERIAPLVVHDRSLRERLRKERAFDTRLEVTGPSRLLRVLAAEPGPYHVTVRNPKAVVEIDLAEGLVVGVEGTRSGGGALEGARALAALLAMGTGRVHVERRDNPKSANLMAPVDEALARASQESSPIPLSMPPPSFGDARGGAGKKMPFPSASELGKSGLFVEDAEPSIPPPRREPESSLPPDRSARSIARDLRWDASADDSPIPGRSPVRTAGPPAPIGAAKLQAPVASARGSGGRRAITEDQAKPRAVPAADAPTASVLGPPVVGPDPSSWAHEDGQDDTRVYDSTELAQLVEGDAVPKVEPPAPPPAPAGRAVAAQRRATLVMGGPAVPPPGARPGSSPGMTAASGPARQSSSPPGPPASAALTRAGLGGRKKTLQMMGGAPLPPAAPAAARAPSVPPSLEPPPGAVIHGTSRPPAARAPEPGATDDLSGAGRMPTPSTGAVAIGRFATKKSAGGSLPSTEPSVVEHLPRESVKPATPVTTTESLASGDLPPTVGRAQPPPRVPTEPVFDANAPLRSGDMLPPILDPGLAADPTPPPMSIPTAVISGAPPAAPDPPVATPAPAPAVQTAAAAARPKRKRRRGRSLARWVALILVGLSTLVLLAVLAWVGARRAGLMGDAEAWLGSVLAGLPGMPTTAPAGDDAGADLATLIGSLDASTAETSDAGTEVADAGEPQVADTQVADTQATDTQVADTQVADTQATDTQVADTQVADTQTTDTQTTDTQTTDTQTTDTQTTDTQVADTQTTDTQAAGTTGAATDAQLEGTDADALIARAQRAPLAEREALYRRALALDPRNHYAMIGVAEALLAAGRPADAIPFIEQAIARRRGRSSYRVMLGDARRDTGDAAGAERAWREALEIDPQDRDAHARLGE